MGRGVNRVLKVVAAYLASPRRPVKVGRRAAACRRPVAPSFLRQPVPAFCSWAFPGRREATPSTSTDGGATSAAWPSLFAVPAARGQGPGGGRPTRTGTVSVAGRLRRATGDATPLRPTRAGARPASLGSRGRRGGVEGRGGGGKNGRGGLRPATRPGATPSAARPTRAAPGRNGRPHASCLTSGRKQGDKRGRPTTTVRLASRDVVTEGWPALSGAGRFRGTSQGAGVPPRVGPRRGEGTSRRYGVFRRLATKSVGLKNAKASRPPGDSGARQGGTGTGVRRFLWSGIRFVPASHSACSNKTLNIVGAGESAKRGRGPTPRVVGEARLGTRTQDDRRRGC